MGKKQTVIQRQAPELMELAALTRATGLRTWRLGRRNEMPPQMRQLHFDFTTKTTDFNMCVGLAQKQLRTRDLPRSQTNGKTRPPRPTQ